MFSFYFFDFDSIDDKKSLGEKPALLFSQSRLSFSFQTRNRRDSNNFLDVLEIIKEFDRKRPTIC